MNLPETAKLQEIYGEQKSAEHVSKILQIIFQKSMDRIRQNTLQHLEEQRSLVIIQIITVVK